MGPRTSFRGLPDAVFRPGPIPDGPGARKRPPKAENNEKPTSHFLFQPKTVSKTALVVVVSTSSFGGFWTVFRESPWPRPGAARRPPGATPGGAGLVDCIQDGPEGGRRTPAFPSAGAEEAHARSIEWEWHPVKL